jgi:endonuclease/exonuclease/phosphatase family metal-dependent hydrolase
MRDPYGWGLRDFMWEKVRKLKKALNKATDDSKYIVLGDLNTMGMSYSFGDKDVTGPEEVERMKKMVKSRTYNMRLLSKSHDHTYYNGTGSTYPPANLDHVFATKNINFESQNGAEVSVEGWTTSDDPDQWIKDYSDHAYLYFEVKSD